MTTPEEPGGPALEPRLKCGLCKAPMPEVWHFVMWCNECLDEFKERHAKNPALTVDAFVAEKRAATASPLGEDAR